MCEVRDVDEEATLVVVTIGKDDDGFPVETTEYIPVWVQEKSVTRSEFYSALHEGITIKAVFDTRVEDWEQSARIVNGKKEYATKVVHDGANYDIIRTYQKDKATIELMCS